MKKTYITPSAKAIQISACSIICASGDPQVSFNSSEYSGPMYSPGRFW